MLDEKEMEAVGSVEDKFKEMLALACRVLGNSGHDDLNLGHLSVRAPGSFKSMFMKGRGLCLSEVHVPDLVTIDFNYNKIEGKRDSHGELPIHIEIYKLRNDVNCVVHTHPIYATAFSATCQTLRPINNEGVMFASPLPHFDMVTDLIVTSELGHALAQKLGDEKAILLKNHGIVVVGDSIEQAVVRAYLLEKTIKTLFIAKIFGKPQYTEDTEAAQKSTRIFTKPKIKAMWEALVRQLIRKEKQEKALESLLEK
ncbi:MAG: class II aldolase/adducin family protein [Desulfobacteraceae bacterium]|nr:class II aldolase/adducin family protein [Desulfobacteraceae bacterium]